jgi:hypothetical protein
MKLLSQIFTLAITTVIGVLISLLSTYIFIDLADAYMLEFITRFSFGQVFGILYLIGFVLSRSLSKLVINESNGNTSFAEAIGKEIEWQIGMTIAFLIAWGIGLIMANIVM